MGSMKLVILSPGIGSDSFDFRGSRSICHKWLCSRETCVTFSQVFLVTRNQRALHYCLAYDFAEGALLDVSICSTQRS